MTVNKAISSLLASSIGKLGGIRTNVRKETENLARLIGTAEPLSEIGAGRYLRSCAEGRNQCFGYGHKQQNTGFAYKPYWCKSLLGSLRLPTAPAKRWGFAKRTN
ncbi:MAG: hypothetical protein LKE43_02090 [Olsenella sp.]|nr:hypothetical protein [Olsenella sp.]